MVKQSKKADQEKMLQDRITDLESQLKRVAADFENYRRRADEDKHQLVPLIQARLLLELTPVLDNFRRATEHLPAEIADNSWVTGVLYVKQQLEQIFTQHGVEKIETVGELFDPAKHEAISTESSDQPVNTIIAEIECGYFLNGKVLKPAKVKVSAGPATPS